MTQLRRAAIVSPIRTAVGKFGGSLSSVTAGDLGAVVLKALIERESARRLALLGGSEPNLQAAPRRRTEPEQTSIPKP